MIHRQYPAYKEKIPYPYRYTKATFLNYKHMLKDSQLIQKYNLWIKGIDYTTGKPVATNSVYFKNLGKIFMICEKGFETIFMNLHGINQAHYMQETVYIYQAVDVYNLNVEFYNKQIELLKKLIGQFTDWEQYIGFDGKLYGLPPVFNNIHYENNCLGQVSDSCDKCHTLLKK